jgi:hypothetical protein
MLKREAQAEGLIERRSAAQRFRSMILRVSVAAMLVAAIGAAIVMRQAAPADDVVRGTVSASPVEGLMMAYAADGTPTLVWTPMAAAGAYHVEIFSEDGQPVWTGVVTAPPLRWPAQTPRTRGMYRWRVVALNRDGTIARSRLMPLELSR